LCSLEVSAGADPCDTERTLRAWVCPDLVPPSPLVHLTAEGGEEMTELRPEPTAASSPIGVQTVPCVYCREPIAADTFVYWSPAKKLLSATCCSCQRRVTLPSSTWRRWSLESVSLTVTT